MKLQSDSPYHPAKNQQRHASENKTFFQQNELTDDVRTLQTYVGTKLTSQRS